MADSKLLKAVEKKSFFKGEERSVDGQVQNCTLQAIFFVPFWTLLCMTFPLLQEEEFVRLNYGIGFVPKIDSHGGGTAAIECRAEPRDRLGPLCFSFEHHWWSDDSSPPGQESHIQGIWQLLHTHYEPERRRHNMFLNQY